MVHNFTERVEVVLELIIAGVSGKSTDKKLPQGFLLLFAVVVLLKIGDINNLVFPEQLKGRIQLIHSTHITGRHRVETSSRVGAKTDG